MVLKYGYVDPKVIHVNNPGKYVRVVREKDALSFKNKYDEMERKYRKLLNTLVHISNIPEIKRCLEEIGEIKDTEKPRPSKLE